ncbi:hypothetical protein [Prescottella equi]|uniref:Uncharacterized protein n=1 Tax=Rhodococcus hoagii TaxID=43767 RepID=A0AAP2F8W8_RHOHA|nr:hypothetical protein [Prescottella equi]MBM4526147.1 hypothetical protein [Prescottella equi]MBM4629814.1 hypothetical protein [Prescottella equi]MBM4651920.1 hypothetical protein [Prescottella equi]MBM4684333.1 hypothetical protein [Prescottella equi]MBM4730589.1 hypothetical protein [Prescottella equi]
MSVHSFSGRADFIKPTSKSLQVRKDEPIDFVNISHNPTMDADNDAAQVKK